MPANHPPFASFTRFKIILNDKTTAFCSAIALEVKDQLIRTFDENRNLKDVFPATFVFAIELDWEK